MILVEVKKIGQRTKVYDFHTICCMIFKQTVFYAFLSIC